MVKNLLDICQKMKRPRLEGSKVQQEDGTGKATDLPKNKALFMALNLSVFISKVGVTAVLPKIGGKSCHVSLQVIQQVLQNCRRKKITMI